MTKADVFFFLFALFENVAFAEEYRVSDGMVSVQRVDGYIKFDYSPDDVSDYSHVVYLYYLQGEDRGFRELRIHQIKRPTIFVSVNATGETVYVSSRVNRCYCALRRCEPACKIAGALFGIWERKLRIDRHLINLDHIIIF